MAFGIAELIVSSNEASQFLVNLKGKRATARKQLLDARNEAAALEAKFAAAVAATEALPATTPAEVQLKTEALTKAAALRAERQAFQTAIEADLTALEISYT